MADFSIYNDSLDIIIDIAPQSDPTNFTSYPYNANLGYGNYPTLPQGAYVFKVRVVDDTAQIQTAVFNETYSRKWNMTISSDKKSATYSLNTGISETTQITFDCTVLVDGIVSTGDVVWITNNVENGTLYLTQKNNPEKIYTILYNGNAGYHENFPAPLRDYDVKLVIPEGFKYVEAIYKIDSDFPSMDEYMTVNGRDATCEFLATQVDYVEGLIISATLEEDVLIPTISGTFNNLHELDSTNLRKLQKVVVTSMSSEGATTVSPDQYIINVVRLPLPIPDDVKTFSDKVIVGETSIDGLETMKIKVDSLSYSLGQIFTPKKYNNSYDYLNTKCLLHLPYCQTIEIEPNYVIGETITIKYEISLYDGVGTVNIYSSKIDDVIISEAVKVGTSIPFFNRDNGQYTSKSMDLLSIYNKLKYAYMEVLRNVPANVDNPFKAVTKKLSKIGDLTGFFKVENILLESSANNQDRDKIVSLLENGVIIK